MLERFPSQTLGGQKELKGHYFATSFQTMVIAYMNRGQEINVNLSIRVLLSVRMEHPANVKNACLIIPTLEKVNPIF